NARGDRHPPSLRLLHRQRHPRPTGPSARRPHVCAGGVGMSTLFSMAADSVAITSDDCYTPRWVFDAMGLHFDLDVAAPIGGPWHVPCDRYYTAVDDGLDSPWEGIVWCNPPYSDFERWADRWIAHDRGVLLGYQLPQVRW